MSESNEARAETAPTLPEAPESPESPELPAERVRGAVRVLVRLRRVMERADTGVTLPQYQLLALVGLRGERSARLAERLAVRKPTVTATADGLVAAGLLERQAEDGDRRVVRLRLTEAGLAAADRAERALAEAVGPLLAESGDPGALLDLLDAVGEALDRRAEEHLARKLAPPVAGEQRR
jgi:DNA-binding MarR family transcriptional regulator